MAKIYVASSWKNPYQPQVVKKLREQGHEVFDFRNPPDGKGGFFWRDVDPNWEQWTTRDYISHLDDEWSDGRCRQEGHCLHPRQGGSGADV